MKAVLAYQGRHTYLVRGSDEYTRCFQPFSERTIIYHSLKAAKQHARLIDADEGVATPLKNVVKKPTTTEAA